MGRSTKPLSGGAKDKFLRSLVTSVDGIPADVARAVTQQLTASISEVRARRDVYERIREGVPTTRAAAQPVTATLPQINPAPPDTTAFDPFAFSAVAVLTKKGRVALAAELEKIASGEHLRRLAEAQHLALDPAVTDVIEMRASILIGTERRIAERKAAAS